MPERIGNAQLKTVLSYALDAQTEGVKRVLILPPDGTRAHSGAGQITPILYDLLKKRCRVDIMPALGTHEPMSDKQLRRMFGKTIPLERYYTHNWRTDTITLGEVPADFVSEVSQGRLNESIPVEINRRLPKYDLILSVGQVVPHEVAGMANYTKNIVVGVGGAQMIHASHFLGAVHGIEDTLGRADTPVRKVFDYAQQHFLSQLPILYILTVVGEDGINGIFIGSERRMFEEAALLSQQRNIQLVDKPIQKAVAFLDEEEFTSCWLANKAIYRLRLAMADKGELIVVAPGVRRFGEDEEIDALIRRHGYRGRDRTLAALQNDPELMKNRSAAAHLVHGSSEGRFTITYAPGRLKREEVEGVGYGYLDCKQALEQYNPDRLEAGWNTLDNGEQIYAVHQPSLGLWAASHHFPQLAKEREKQGE